MFFNFKPLFLAIIFVIIFFAVSFVFAGNIDSTYKWAWSDNIGWLDFTNVTVGSLVLTGTASSSGVGTISMNCAEQNSCGSSNYKVNNDGCGYLSGWAWNENIGWISFCGNASGPSTWNGSKWVCPSSPTYRVLINNTTGDFSGWAWSGNIGWISFNCLQGGCCGSCNNWKVKTSWNVASATTSGTLISSIYDSKITPGVAYNLLRWRGNKPANTEVRFQIASSRCANGATNPPTCNTNVGWGGTKTSGSGAFVGHDGTNSTWYSPAADTWIRIDGPASGVTGCLYSGLPCHNNNRYFRYKVELTANYCSGSPRVDEVTLSWSP